jgi:hypothetical protein
MLQKFLHGSMVWRFLFSISGGSRQNNSAMQTWPNLNEIWFQEQTRQKKQRRCLGAARAIKFGSIRHMCFA